MVVKKEKQKRVERLNKNKEGGMGNLNLGKKFLNKAKDRITGLLDEL